MRVDLQDPGPAARLIPGAYERNTLTHRQPGSMGADPSAAVPAGPSTMTAATIAEREREGGGAPSQRRHRRVSMVSDVASHPSLSAVHDVSPEQQEEGSAERWRKWQVRNAVSSRSSARQARVAFTVIFAAVGAWLGLLLIPSLWR